MKKNRAICVHDFGKDKPECGGRRTCPGSKTYPLTQADIRKLSVGHTLLKLIKAFV